MLPAQYPGRQRLIALLLLSLLPFAFLLITYVLPPPLPIAPAVYQLDRSWQIILTAGFLHGAQFGRDIIYTYGPWGFLAAPRGDPRIYPWVVGGRLLLALAFVLGTSLLSMRRPGSKPSRFLAAFWIVLLGDPVSVLPMLLLVVTLSPDTRFGNRETRWATSPITHLLAAGCALTVWIKFTQFGIVAALALALATQDLLRRRLPVISMEIAAFALGFWLLARQSLSGLGPFLHGGVAIARSYSAAMSIEGPVWEVCVAGLLLLALVVPGFIRMRCGDVGFLWPSIVWVALLFFLQIKEAFVRQDSFHVWMGIVNGLLPCALILVWLTGAFGSGRLQPPRITMVNRVCAAWIVVLSLVFPAIEWVSLAGGERIEVMATNAAAMKEVLLGESLSARYQRQLIEYRRARPLTRVEGAASFFPDDSALLYGNSISVRLPPIPQAFAAYNSYLSTINSSFYRSARRPDFVFFDVAPIDNRYPTASDTLSWLALLDCYLPSGNSGSYLVLRASGCRNAPLEFVSATTTEAGKIIQVPPIEGHAVWVQFNIRPNRAGRMIAIFARPPLTELTVRSATGQSTFRISPDAADTGFLLSPLILTASSFGSLFTNREINPAAKIHEMMIVQSDSAGKFFEPAIDVRFYAVPLPRRTP